MHYSSLISKVVIVLFIAFAIHVDIIVGIVATRKVLLQPELSVQENARQAMNCSRTGSQAIKDEANDTIEGTTGVTSDGHLRSKRSSVCMRHAM